ncbi:MAG: glycosyltransferase family 9 protein [Melioribacter sp.]|nr:glycosyltransferase family 9 protein [Melioribacter sp.]
MKILVVNIKYLGDLVVSTPGIRSLSKTYPDSEIVLLIRKGFEPVFKNNPYVKKIISFDTELKGNNSIKKFFSGINFIFKIRKEKFDLVIVLHPGDRTAFWAGFSGSKIRIAPARQSFSFLFNRNVNVEENSMSYLEYYNNIITRADVRIDSNRTEIFFSDEDKNWVNDFISHQNILTNNLLIGIHPGASEPSKIWKVENFVQLINKLLLKPEIRIIVFEGPQDKDVCTEIKNSFEKQQNIYFVNTDVLKVAALISKCKLLIANDTGTRHLAVAVQTPVLALIPEDYEKCWNFYSESDFHFIIFGKRNFSNQDINVKPFLDGINVEDVYKKVGELLKL